MPPRKKKSEIKLGPGQCNLCSRRDSVYSICIPGRGPQKPQLIVIAEAPAATEDTWCMQCARPATGIHPAGLGGLRTKEAPAGHGQIATPSLMSCVGQNHRIGSVLVGPSGVVLDEILTAIGIDTNTVFYTNATRCGSAPKKPTMLECKKCRPYLINELAELYLSECRGIILLGETATRSVLNDGRVKFKEARMRPLDAYAPTPIPLPMRTTFHPAYLLYNKENEATIRQEIIDDIRDLWIPRDPLKPVHHVTVTEDYDTLYPEASLLALDLEWSQDTIRIAGVSDGITNTTTTDPKLLIDWLTSKTKRTTQ